MASKLNTGRSAFEIAERRTRPRTLVTTPIYVDLDNVNGGLIFNLSKSGLALTTARSLPSDNRISMRIQTPDFKGWIEASGEIAWRSKSNKEAGVRFVGLAEDAEQQISDWTVSETLGGEFHSKEGASDGIASQTAAANEKIRNWIATEARSEEVHSEKDTSAPLPGLSEGARQRLRNWIFQGAPRKDSGVVKGKVPAKVEQPGGAVSECAPRSSISEAENPALIVNKEKKDVAVRAKTDPRLEEKERVVAKPSLPQAQAAPDMLQDAGDALGTAERRVRARTLLTPPIYVDLEKVNGGLVYDMSEDGIALTAANILRGGGPLNMRIQLPDAGDWIGVTGQIVWKSESGKTAGIKFAGLAEETRQRIGKWLAEESSQGEPQPELAPLPKLEQPPADETPARALKISPPEPAKQKAAVEKSMQQPVLSEASSVLSGEPAGIVAEPIPQQTPVVSDQEIDGKSSPQTRERRSHSRSRIKPISYIELGADNGGVLLNIGEGGLAVNAAMPLSMVDVPTIRIQCTGSQADWIEVSGQLAWIGESKKEAGIRFIKLTEEARQKIASRISREELQQELPPQSVKMLEGRATRPEKPEIPSVEIPIPIPVAGPSGRAVQEHSQGPVPSRPAAPSMRVAKAPATAVAPGASHPKSPKKKSGFKPKTRPLFHPIASQGRTKTLWRFAAMFVLAAVTAAAIGWVVAAPAIRNEVIAFIAKNIETAGKPTEVQESLPKHKSADVPALGSENNVTGGHKIEPVPADRPANGSETHPAPPQPQVKTMARPAAKPTVSGLVGRAESSAPKNLPPKTPERTVVAVPNPTVESARRQPVESSTAQPKENTAAATTSPAASVPSGTTLPEVKEKESPPPPRKQPVAPVGPIWSVAVSTDPYPSIRIPTNVSSQRATPGKNLQIGRAISRVEPVYPEDAKRQGIEGTVRLHIIVGRDGAVQNVELASGPALLAKAAESAVREWRYGQTLLGGQPVETEQDIVVKFKLASPSNSNN